MGAPVRVGDVVAEKYEVRRVLGVGGMGVVVAAHHRELDKLVALKFMHEEVAQSAQAIDRFLREARAAARLQSEHVGHVLDVGRLNGGVPYIVMEYLEGQDLAAVLDAQGPMPVSQAVEYVLQTCEGIAEAHAQGIIHRDLKPQNLFLTSRPNGRRLIKVLDFGISKALFANAATATQATMGSPAYMSPEQIRSARSVDARSDIWSLGVILYQLLSNSLPWYGESVTETMLKVIEEPLPPLAARRSGVPAALLSTVERCLEKDRERRFANVAELAREIEPYRAEHPRAGSQIEHVSAGTSAQVVNYDPAQARGIPIPATIPATQTTLGSSAAESLDLQRPRRGSGRWRWAVVSALGVAAGIGIAASVMAGARTHTSQSASDAASQPKEAIPPTDSYPPVIHAVVDASVDALAVDALPVEPPTRPKHSRTRQPADAVPATVPSDASMVDKPDASIFRPPGGSDGTFTPPR